MKDITSKIYLGLNKKTTYFTQLYTLIYEMAEIISIHLSSSPSYKKRVLVFGFTMEREAQGLQKQSALAIGGGSCLDVDTTTGYHFGRVNLTSKTLIVELQQRKRIVIEELTS